MLAVSDSAAQAIDEILGQQQAPDGSGLRIGIVAEDGQAPQLGLGLAAAPAENDVVVEHNGTHVFVDGDLADAVDDKVLDAQTEGEQVAFTMRDQPV